MQKLLKGRICFDFYYLNESQQICLTFFLLAGYLSLSSASVHLNPCGVPVIILGIFHFIFT